MKTLLFFFTTLLIVSACRFPSTPIVKDQPGDQDPQKSQNIDPSLFTLAHAERILGEPARMTESETHDSVPHSTYNVTYKSVQKDSISNDTGAIYVMFEIYPVLDSARAVYTTLYAANNTHGGLQNLQDYGDEAYFHSDSTNFYYIMARKGNKILRMKVNRMTSRTSVDAFQKVTKEILDAM